MNKSLKNYYNKFISLINFIKRYYCDYKKPWIDSLLVAFLVLLIFMAFRPGIIEWCNNHVFPFLEMERTGWSDSLLCVVALVCVYYSYFKTPKVIGTGWLSIMLSGWLLIGLFLEYDQDWCGVCLFDCQWLPYSAILLFSVTIPWIIKYGYYLYQTKRFNKQNKQNRRTESNGFTPISDNALKKASDDAFGWADHVRRLISEVLKSSYETSISVAITGTWGSGKTSYMTLLKEELKGRNNEFSVIEFNPRRSASASTIQTDFLHQLRNKLSDYDSSIGGYVSKYIEALQIADENSILPKLISLTGIDNPDHYKESIEEVIKSSGKSIIVLIDDLDRLTGIEIMEVLKLVNLNVNFENSIFISAFDKDYVEKALSSIIINRETVSDESSSIRNYTDKYFTFERPLPNVKPERLVKYLYDLIKTNIVPEEDSDSYQTIQSFLKVNQSLIYEYIRTIRDVKRFSNLLIPTYLRRKNDVTFEDFCLLCMLRYRHPDIYEKIRCREIVNTNIIDNSSQVFRQEIDESVPGHKILSMLFEKYSKDTAFSLNRKHFKSIRHKKAFPLYFYEYDEASICFKDYLGIIDPSISLHEAKIKLRELVYKGSDTYSILDLIYDHAVRMTYSSIESYKRGIELRVFLAGIINDFTVRILLSMTNVMPDKDNLIKLGFGEGSAGKSAYREWLYNLILGLDTTYGTQYLLQCMMYTFNGPEEEALTRDRLIELIKHHMNVLADVEEDKSIDANLFFQLLLSSGIPADNTITNLDSECINIASRLLLRKPELFYPMFFQGFKNQEKTFYKVMINPNGMAAVVNNNNTYEELVRNIHEKTDIISKAIVHFYNNCYSKGTYEWDIEYPEGFKHQDYTYNFDMMKALFEKVIGEI